MTKRKGVMGAENEVKVYGSDGKFISFQDLLSRASVGFLRQSEKGVWWEGGYAYEDVNEHLRGRAREKSKLIEFSTHPVELRRGCSTKLADIITYNIALLASISDGLNVAGYRRQYCISVDSILEDVDLGRARASMPIHPNVRPSFDGRRAYKLNKFQVDISKIILSTVGPALVLLLGNRGERKFTLSPWYPGLSQRDKIEFDAELLMNPTQLKAAIAFLVGTERGIERLIKESVLDYSKGNLVEDYNRMPLEEVYKRMPFLVTNARLIPGPLKASLRAIGYGEDVYAFGSKALLDVQKGSKRYALSCQDILKAYFNFFQDDIAALATSREMDLLRKYVKGKGRVALAANYSLDVNSPRIDAEIFNALYGRSADEYIEMHRPRDMTLLFADAMEQQEKVVTEKNGEKVTRETIVKQTKNPRPDWNGVAFRLTLTYGDKTRVARIYVPRDRYADYLGLERRMTEPKYFFEKAGAMFR